MEKVLITTRFLELPIRDIDRWIGESDTIADLGCGRGVLANILLKLSPNRSIYGVDLSEGRIERAIASAQGNSRLEFIVADVTDPQLYRTERRFDIVLVSEVLYLLSHGKQEQVLDSVASILKPDGKLIIKDYTTRPWYKYYMFWIETNLLYLLVNSIYSVATKFGKLGHLFRLITIMFGVRDNVTVSSPEQFVSMLTRTGWRILSGSFPSHGFWPHYLSICQKMRCNKLH